MIHHMILGHLVYHSQMFPNRMLILQFNCIFVDFVFAKKTRLVHKILTKLVEKHQIEWRKVTFDRSKVSF